MSDPTNADQPDVLEQPDAVVEPGATEPDASEPDDVLGVNADDGDPMDETTPVANLE